MDKQKLKPGYPWDNHFHFLNSDTAHVPAPVVTIIGTSWPSSPLLLLGCAQTEKIIGLSDFIQFHGCLFSSQIEHDMDMYVLF